VLARSDRRVKMKDLARDRVLSDDELQKLWLAAEKYPGPFGAYLRFTLLTATRRSESAACRRSEIGNGGGTWIIPGGRYKSGKDMVIPLSETARKIVAAQPVLSGGDYIFGADGSRPMGGFDARKADFDKIAGIHNYRLHDLRRTARTLLSRAGVPADIGERCLGHLPGGVRGTYDRHAYQVEKAAAFEALAAQIERIVRPPPVGDQRMLPMLELFLRTAQRERGMRRAEALRWWIKSCVTKDGQQLFGKNADAVFGRLRRKLQPYARQRIEDVWQEIKDRFPEPERSRLDQIDPKKFALG
jgi:hypothetical protein